MICDIGYPDGRSFEGASHTLKRQIERAAKLGFTMRVGWRWSSSSSSTERGEPTTRALDAGSYLIWSRWTRRAGAGGLWRRSST